LEKDTESKPVKYSPQTPWALESEETLDQLHVTPATGLPAHEIKKRQEIVGFNTLREIKAQSAWAILIKQFKNLIVLFLVAATLLALFFGEYVDAIAIGAVIFINAAVGFFTELRGARAIESLRKLGSVVSRVRRGGHLQEVPASNLVPGDIVVLEGGDIITADLRLITASKVEANESVLTGESLPVSKDPQPVPASALLADRKNMLFKGTSLTRGSGEAVVVATGMHTELGKISSLVAETEDSITPLEQKLGKLGYWLIWLSLALAVFIAVSGILAGKDLFLMIETAIALAVASIPEGLPIVATIALARGMWRMARRNALVKELAAVETLGATTVICTDKTGTLTENILTVSDLLLSEGKVEFGSPQNGPDNNAPITLSGNPTAPSENPLLLRALETMSLCNNASLGQQLQNGETAPDVGDPLETALLVAARKGGIEGPEIMQRMPEMREEAFDSVTKLMATFNQKEEGFLVSVKGAPEAVLDACSSVLTLEGADPFSPEIKKTWPEIKKTWIEANEEMARGGLRVLALATKFENSKEAPAYEDLQFIGLVGFQDPPRADAKEAIALCRRAGVKVIMATGDQAVTAGAIGLAVGLVDSASAQVVTGSELKHSKELSDQEKAELRGISLFARVSPAQKLDLIDIHQQGNAIVAMTGDGVNDAPALKKADIGIAMGKRGTQVAREASDMILADDAFSSIVYAIEQGRIIFNNIRTFVIYLLSCNLSEIMVVALASFVGLPLPLLPLQILFLNIVTDVFPALALAAGESNPHIMQEPPREKKEPIMERRHWGMVMVYSALITASVLGALVLAQRWLGMDREQAVTISFLTLAFAQLWHVFNMRNPKADVLRNIITRNPFVWGALGLCTLLLAATVYLPGLSTILQVVNPGLNGWLLILVMSALPVPCVFILNGLLPGIMKGETKKAQVEST
jgi:P-type Ca2+ transporter type 2C